MSIFSVRTKKYAIEADHDMHPIDPREANDNFGSMILFHPHYQLGDNHSMTPERLTAALQQPGTIYIPVYLYDHSGLSISDSRVCAWDSSHVGYIYATAAAIKDNFGSDTIDDQKKAMQLLHAEIKEYDKYIRGDQYQIIVNEKRYDAAANEINLEYVYSAGGYDEIADAIDDALQYVSDDPEAAAALRKEAEKYPRPQPAAITV